MSRSTALLEGLEDRRLLSAQVILQIIGSGAGDQITVSQTSTSIVVTENGTTQEFDLGQISRVAINGANGNDRIDCTTLKIPVSIDGDDGDDTIIGSEKSDRIDGGDGDDSILGGKGRDRIRGEEGDDTVLGGKHDDTVDGGGGEDFIGGNEGNDLLDANDDFFEDTVSGGSGFDTAEIDDELGINDDTDDTVEVVNE